MLRMEIGIYVTDIDNGDYIKVRSVDFGEVGACMFSATVSCDTKPGVNNGGSIEIPLIIKMALNWKFTGFIYRHREN